MDEIDDDLSERIYEEGERVLNLFWDSGGPGAGADCESIYKFRNLYWRHDSNEGLSGPYQSLSDAMDDFIGVTSATVTIDCTELTASELSKRLKIYDAESGHSVEINGEGWRVSLDKMLEPRKPQKRY